MTDPREAYTRLLDERRATIAECQLRHRKLGYARLAVVLAAAAIAVLALGWQAINILWMLVPGAIFAGLMVAHDRVLKDLERRRRAAAFFEKSIARLDGKWPGAGEPGDRYLTADHPYAADLDIFGKGSLFELLSTARTHIGEETLARWLMSPAEPEAVRARNRAVDEVRPRIDLREDLAVAGEEARTGVDPISLAEWGEAPAAMANPNLRLIMWLFTVLGMLGFTALAIWVVAIGGFLHLSPGLEHAARDIALAVLLVNLLFQHRHRPAAMAVIAAVEEAAHELELLSEVLYRLEREHFQSPLLAKLRHSLDSAGEPPSRHIARLNQLVERLDSRDNVAVRVLDPFILWTMHTAAGVENWRRRSGPAVRRWLTATGEIEALCSLAGYAFDHPGDPFPEFLEGSVAVEAEGICHPFLAPDHAVRNDVHLGGAPQVLIVSGSNMSGKSTLLRTLGVNAVLAQAGAPVRARRFRLTPLAIGASIKLSDSLQGGVSRFYAEILRIRQILTLTSGALPVLFLIDEFLAGTNSHDRRIGASALVRGLVERGAIGLVTTHDLALADIVEALGERAANVHFEDRVEGGKILFDYVMRPGVVRKSNALELMRSVGLEI
ncbi:MAG TPA: hypothetical protein VMB03_29670 [Bryobacteraceae bacterium]|nr:hypothetical protein [Bryobacteraceae bacterium]